MFQPVNQMSYGEGNVQVVRLAPLDSLDLVGSAEANKTPGIYPEREETPRRNEKHGSHYFELFVSKQ